MNTQAEIRREARRQVPLSQRIKHTAVQTVIYIFCTVMLLVCVLPIWLLFVDATRSTTEINQGMSLIPSGYFAMNWGTLMSKDFPLIQAFFNSIVISFSSTALSLYFSALWHMRSSPTVTAGKMCCIRSYSC